MRRLRRQPRAVYRICGEDEYLAGVDPFADWDIAPAESRTSLAGRSARPAGISRERRLRRLAGAAALTGAVGTVGTTIAVVGLRSHLPARQVAANVSLPAHPAMSAIHRPDTQALPARPALRRDAIHRDWRRGKSGHPGPAGGRSDRIARRRRLGPHTSASTDVTEVAQTVSVASSAPTGAPSYQAAEPRPARDAPAPVASAAQSPPAEAEPRPRAQSEFGFER